jgi:hypothetical protein
MNFATDHRPAAYPDLKRVIDCLDDALRLFTEGDPEQACQCLAEANCVFASCPAEIPPEAGATASIGNGTLPCPVEREEAPLVRAATA